MHGIEYSSKAKKFLEKLDKHILTRIIGRIEHLKVTPIPSDSKFIGRDNGDKLFRYRIGDYRVLYKVKDKEKVVLIGKIDKRSRIYL